MSKVEPTIDPGLCQSLTKSGKQCSRDPRFGLRICKQHQVIKMIAITDKLEPIDWQTKTPEERFAEAERLTEEHYGIDQKTSTDRSKWPVLKLRFPEDK